MLLLTRPVRHICVYMHHQASNISRTESQNLNVSRLVLMLSLPNPLKPGVKSMPQLHLSDQQVYYLLRCGLYWMCDGIYEWCMIHLFEILWTLNDAYISLSFKDAHAGKTESLESAMRGNVFLRKMLNIYYHHFLKRHVFRDDLGFYFVMTHNGYFIKMTIYDIM